MNVLETFLFLIPQCLCPYMLNMTRGRNCWLSKTVFTMYTYETVHAPPATVFLHDLHVQMPTECRLTVFFPQKEHMYRACCVISIFLTCFRREAPYLWDRALAES